MKQHAKNKQQGFSLLEALVAMFIIALVGGAVLAAFNQEIFGTQKLIQQTDNLLEQASLNQLAQSINPMQHPEGELTLANQITINWTSEPITPIRQNITAIGTPGNYNIALYRLTLSYQHPTKSDYLHHQTVLGYQALQTEIQL